mmetsp:Transcript_32976/g.57726  ORF Transcript_32976/g.57726 Transcript_32976/m.57726 type:complete len:89 (+) Transcript_32976:468-734(+)
MKRKRAATKRGAYEERKNVDLMDNFWSSTSTVAFPRAFEQMQWIPKRKLGANRNVALQCLGVNEKFQTHTLIWFSADGFYYPALFTKL